MPAALLVGKAELSKASSEPQAMSTTLAAPQTNYGCGVSDLTGGLHGTGHVLNFAGSFVIGA